MAKSLKDPHQTVADAGDEEGTRGRTSELWELKKSADIADLYEQLLDAADTGDQRARDFLATFGPWARGELAKRPKS